MTDVSYVPGDRTAIVGDTCWVLIDAAPDSAVVSGIWQQMARGAGLEALLASLLRPGLDQVPDFAVLAAAQGRHHLICRGRVGATLAPDGPAERVDGNGLATWIECRVAAEAGRVVLGDLPGGTGPRLPASAGVFLADSVAVDLTAPPRGRGPGAPSAPAALVTADRSVPPTVRADAVDTILARTSPVVSGHSAAVLPDGAGPRNIDAGLPQENGYDFLFGDTQARTVEGAAVRPADDADDEAGPPLSLPVPQALEPLPPPAGQPAGQWPSSPGSADPAGRGELTGSGGWADRGRLIDSVPWVTEVGYAPPSPGIPAGPAGPRPIDPGPTTVAGADDDGSTVMRGEVSTHASWSAAPDRIGPMVKAVLCSHRHPNPPGTPACGRCGAPLPAQAPVTVPRPVLGVLRLSTGDIITLDRGVVMGRSPRTDFAGPDRPHVVKLPSGDGEISRTHLQVSLDGWHVLVTDLNSTNGTMVALPGRDPERLRPGEPLPIQPGTQVIMAVGIDFRYEAAE
ncbi:MAG: FHA domain-containing protein [Streptosporangiaceae bacterium]